MQPAAEILETALRHLAAGRQAAAEGGLLDFLEAAPSDPRAVHARLALHRLCREAERPEEAEEHLAAAAALATDPQAMGEEALDAGAATVAAAFFREAARRAPAEREAHLALGRTSLLAGEPAAAAKAFEAAVLLDHRDAAARYGLAEALLALGDMPRAESQLHVALTADPDHVPSLLRRSELAFYHRHYRMAAASYERAASRAALAPADYEGWGWASWLAGDAAQAIAAFEAGLAVHPAWAFGVLMAARLCELADRPGQARIHYMAACYFPERREEALAGLARLEGREEAAPAPAAALPSLPPQEAEDHAKAIARRLGPPRPGTAPMAGPTHPPRTSRLDPSGH